MHDFGDAGTAPAVPKILWMLWLQGWSDVPPLVRACRQSWEHHHPGWEIRAIDAQEAVDLVGPCPVPERFPAAGSDAVRVRLLSEFGGVWADATTFCTAPLDRWLSEASSPGFFAFDSPGYGRMLSSWFLAASPHSHIMRRWAEETDRYWVDRDEPDEYFWFHRIFGDLYSSDRDFRRAWDAVPRLSADGPHYFSPYGRGFTGSLTRRASARLAQGVDPMYKLTNRVDPSSVSEDSAYAYFVGGAAWEPPPSAAWSLVDRKAMLLRSWAKGKVNRARALTASVAASE